MSRKRQTKAARKELLPWISANPNNREPHGYVQVGSSFLQNGAFQALPFGTQIVYLCCCLESQGKRRFYFPRQTARKKYGLNWSTTYTALQTLQEKGFLKMVYSGRLTREPNQYEFCFDWKLQNEP